jgi:hypothetical protein
LSQAYSLSIILYAAVTPCYKRKKTDKHKNNANPGTIARLTKPGYIRVENKKLIYKLPESVECEPA